MSLHIKICGFTTAEGIAAAVSAGVDSIGLVLDPSPRQLTLERAAELKALIPAEIDVVAVCGRPTETELSTIIDALQPDSIQLMADAMPVREFSVPLLPAFEDGPDLLVRVEEFCARLNEERPVILADGPRPGSGERADWNRVQSLSDSTRLMIAGGLTPENVGEAIALLNPYGVDVSSGVERAPGHKDPRRVHEFVAAVRSAEERLSSQ